MCVSVDMAGTSSVASQASRWYMKATGDVARYLGTLFQATFPAYYEKYERAFKAGVWNMEDPGPWIARAIVYKLQVLLHQDGMDDGPTASFPMGYFTGGALYLPDIGTKLA